MRSLARILGLCLLTCAIVAGQDNPPTTTQTQGTTQSQGQSESNRQREQRREEEKLLRTQEAFRRMEAVAIDSARENTTAVVYRTKIEPLYRRPGKKELRVVQPDQQDLRNHSAFLNQRDTGIFKLVPDQGCADNTNVVIASAECLKYEFPGSGSSYSIRIENYRIPRLADITFDGENLVAKGVLLVAMFVEIGDVPVESVDLTSKGLGYLKEFNPPEDAETAFAVGRMFIAGIEHGGYVYGRLIKAKKNSTFALRSIAYRGKQLRAVAGVTYDEMHFDNRRDIIIAFRIVRQEPDKSITVVWKKLQDKKSPNLKKL